MASVNVTPGTPPPGGQPPTDPAEELKTKCQTVEKIGRLHRTRSIAEKVFKGLAISFCCIAAAAICFTGVVPIASVITISVAIVAGIVGALFMGLLIGIPLIFSGGIKKKLKETDEELQKQMVLLLIQLKGQEPLEGSPADLALKKYGSRLKELKLDCGEEIFKKDHEWRMQEVQVLIDSLSKYFRNLKTLELQNATDLEGVEFEDLQELKKLEAFKISGSTVNDDQLAALTPLKKVKKLVLQDCPCLSPKIFENLKEWPLKELDLRGTPLKGFQSKDARVYQELVGHYASQYYEKRLRQEKIKIPAKDKYQIKPDDKEKVKTHKTEALKEELEKAPKKCKEIVFKRKYHLLEANYAPRDQWSPVLEEADLGFLKNFKKLEKLSISHIEDSALKQVASLKKLTSLNISHSSVFTGAGFVHLKPLENLAHLTFGTCRALEPESFRSLNRDLLRNIKDVDFEWDVDKYGGVQEKARWNTARQDLRKRFVLQKNKPKKKNGVDQAKFDKDVAKYNRMKGSWKEASAR